MPFTPFSEFNAGAGGEKAFPEEVEGVLRAHPDVYDVVVVGVPDDRWGQRVVAFVKRRDQVSFKGLDAHCRSSDLVNFKRPREYVPNRGVSSVWGSAMVSSRAASQSASDRRPCSSRTSTPTWTLTGIPCGHP